MWSMEDSRMTRFDVGMSMDKSWHKPLMPPMELKMRWKSSPTEGVFSCLRTTALPASSAGPMLFSAVKKG